MKARDIKIGEFYLVEFNPKRIWYDANGCEKKSGQPSFKPKKGYKFGGWQDGVDHLKDKIVRCTKVHRHWVGPLEKRRIMIRTEYNVYDVNNSYIGTCFIPEHSCLTRIAAPTSMKNKNSNPSVSRKTQATSLRAKIATKTDEYAKLIEQVVSLYEEIHALTQKAETFERFETDEEELAHTFSEIIKTGGDEHAILKILKDRTETNKL
jgi:hypothetical protein